MRDRDHRRANVVGAFRAVGDRAMLGGDLIVLLVRVMLLLMILTTGANVLGETIKAIAIHVMP